MHGHRLFLKCALGASLICTPALASAQQQNHPVLDAPGFQHNRDYFSEMPFEHIDTLTGSLILKFTDLVLPGNAGHELRFERTYNSKTRGWTFGLVGIPLHISDGPTPIEVSHPQDGAPALLMSDGGVRKMAWVEFPTKAVSSEFWLFDRTVAIRRLFLPNGDTCDYEADSQSLLRVKSCKDAFNNETEFEWSLSASPPHLLITQDFGSVSREITVTFPEGISPGMSYPTSLTYDERTWNYSPTSVTPPGGAPGWTFEYDGNSRLSKLTTPHGGEIIYEYDTLPYEGPDPQSDYWTEVVKKRSTGGRAIVAGDWEYNYDISTSGISGNTTVLTPSGRIKYQHGTNDPPQSVFDGEAGVLPLVSRVIEWCTDNCSAAESGRTFVKLESEERTYKFLPVTPGGFLGTLELETRTLKRYDATEASTQYFTRFEYDVLYFGNYHNPYRIIETGPARERTTVRTFRPPTSTPYLLVLPQSEQVTVDAETFTKSWTYASNGFKTSETIPVLNIQAALTDPQRWNRYSYAVNRPLVMIDPDGRDPLLVGGAIGAAVYAGWNAYMNVQSGRSWYDNIGVEASKGFIVGVTLGLAAPALAGTTTAEVITSAPLAATLAAKSSSEIGKIIGWGAGQSAADVAQTVRVTRELGAGRVAQLAQQGVTREWVEKQLGLYQKSLEAGGNKLNNAQLLPRIELMKKLLEHWPELQ